MQQATHKTLYNTHSWIGIWCGILLFVVTFSGLPAMFAHELEVWQSPALSQLNSTDDAQLDPILQQARNNGFDYDNYFIVPELDAGNQIIHQGSFNVPPGTPLEDIKRQGESDHEPNCLVEGIRRVIDREVELHFHRIVKVNP